jgi:hypothetical protein
MARLGFKSGWLGIAAIGSLCVLAAFLIWSKAINYSKSTFDEIRSDQFVARPCPLSTKENEQFIYDKVKRIGFVVPASWSSDTVPGESIVSQSFYSTEEANVDGTKCDLDMNINPRFLTSQGINEYYSRGKSKILRRKKVSLCGMKKSVYIVSSDSGSDRSMAVFAQTSNNEIVILHCYGVNTAPMVPILGSLYADSSAPISSTPN